jgi:hypothetical protein
VADDKLRPSFEKLVRATNDVEKAQKLQTLALDIAAGSGKDLETVSVALAKAYDGNNTSLQRLGVGLSAAELKSMSFDDVTKSLAETFGGQASVQADTLSGKMARMQRAFDEAKESVGARLLPILTQLLDTFNTKVGPAVQAIQDKLKPLTKAIDDNKEEFTALWNFLNKYIVPIMTGALKSAFSGIVTGITAVVNIVGKAVNFFQNLYAAYKKIVDFVKNNPLSQFLGKLNPFGNANFMVGDGNGDGDGGDEGDGGGGNFSNPFTSVLPFVPSQQYLDAIARRRELEEETAAIRKRIADRKAGITTTSDTSTKGIVINVNAASVIDSEGFTRAVIDALNESQARTGSLDTLGV